jgi:hypothetical protein
MELIVYNNYAYDIWQHEITTKKKREWNMAMVGHYN